MSLTCRDCGTDLPYKGRGRPPMRCHGCKRKLSAAKKRAYYEQNKDEIAAKQRAYREQKLTCSECGERMRHPSDSGLCGFCEEEASVAA